MTWASHPSWHQRRIRFDIAFVCVILASASHSSWQWPRIWLDIEFALCWHRLRIMSTSTSHLFWHRLRSSYFGNGFAFFLTSASHSCSFWHWLRVHLDICFWHSWEDGGGRRELAGGRRDEEWCRIGAWMRLEWCLNDVGSMLEWWWIDAWMMSDWCLNDSGLTPVWWWVDAGYHVHKKWKIIQTLSEIVPKPIRIAYKSF